MTDPISEYKFAVKTVVVPAAGLGTRFLPATKTVPKELLPVVDTPGIELIAQEASRLGASRLAVITAPNKKGVCQRTPRSEETSTKRRERNKKNKRSAGKNHRFFQGICHR